VTGPVTGPGGVADPSEDIRRGAIGSMLNLYGAEHVRERQRLAVEESRLRIPLLIGLDILHGYRTLFPVGLAEACLFDPTAWEQTAREAAREASTEGVAMTFAPMLDVSRDPRWGRSVEGPGEDPLVARRMAHAKVRGLQSANLTAADALAAVAKHYCAYGAVTAGREYASVDLSERTMLEVHLPAFAAAVNAGVAAVMPAFMDLAGIPMTANVPMLRGWLRGRLAFDGVIISDYNAIGELLQHGVAADMVEAAALALRAGVDIDMMSDAYRHGLAGALERGLVSMTLVDEAVRRVLRLKERLGLFDDPYRRGATREEPGAVTRRRALARQVAARSIVLLTHRHDVLPLSAGLRRLGVLGPLADAGPEMRGSWWAAASEQGQVSVLAGLQAALPGAQLLHALGVPIEAADDSGWAAALQICAEVDAIVLCVGEGALMSGEAASRARLDLPGEQRRFAEAVLDRAAALGKPVIVVLFSGRPLIVPWLMDRADAVLAAWFPGSEAGNAIADVLVGQLSPSGRTAVTWARELGQVPIFYAQRPSGRPAAVDNHYSSRYIDAPVQPQFPFGHGLSYGRFTLSDLRIAPAVLRAGDTLEVQVAVANDGKRAAEETVFLFSHDRVASVARPTLELKDWAKIELAPGERGVVRLRVPAEELRFLGPDLSAVFESGELEILVGPCADRARLLAGRVQLSGD
jgi:beta-glucosidase